MAKSSLQLRFAFDGLIKEFVRLERFGAAECEAMLKRLGELGYRGKAAESIVDTTLIAHRHFKLSRLEWHKEGYDEAMATLMALEDKRKFINVVSANAGSGASSQTLSADHIMGDQNSNSGNAGIVGGSLNTANVGSQVQSGNQIDVDIDWNALPEELDRLKSHLVEAEERDPDDGEISTTLGSVKAAASSLRKGDKSKFSEYLIGCGKAAYGFAKELGLTVLTKYLEAKLGIPTS